MIKPDFTAQRHAWSRDINEVVYTTRINRRGDVVGVMRVNFTPHGFLVLAGSDQIILLENFTGANGVNDNATTIVGAQNDAEMMHAEPAVWTLDPITKRFIKKIVAPGPRSFVFGINSFGDQLAMLSDPVGVQDNFFKAHGSDAFVQLQRLIPPESGVLDRSQVTKPFLDDRRQIAGCGPSAHDHNRTHAWVLQL